MHASILSVHGPLWPHVKHLKLLNFDFNVDPNPAFLSNADPDLASHNNTDPGPDAQSFLLSSIDFFISVL
jgi:hypothetical protein